MSRKLLKSTGSVAGFTMLSRVLGFVRDIIFAAIFGAGVGFDAFVIAFKIPNFFRRLFGEGAFSQAFVPVLAEMSETESPEAMRQFIDRMAGSLSVILLLLVVLGEVFAPAVVLIFAPGFAHDPTRLLLARHMVHLTLPYMLFICLVAFSGALLNTFHKFSVPAFTPVLLNVCLILAAWFLTARFKVPIYAVAVGVLVAGVVQFVFQIPFLKKARLLPRLRLGFKDPAVRRVMKLMVPALFGVSVAQISLLVDNFFASFLRAGSISWLYYSDRLTYLPLGVIGVALATVVLPRLSRLHSRASQPAFDRTVQWAIRMVLLFGLPAGIGLMVLSGPLLATLIHHGAFNNFDVYMTQRSLIAFAFGLPAFMSIKIFASVFYARKDIKTPVKIAVVALMVNVVLNFILIHPLAQAGLALSSSVAAMVNVLALWWLLKVPPEWRVYGCIFLAALAMLAVLYFVSPATRVWLSWGEWHRVGMLVLLLLLGKLTYFGLVWALGLRKRDFVV